MELEIIKGDITKIRADAIVNAANSTLLGGGGVDGAIHKAAGPKLLEECKGIRKARYPGGLSTGEAVITKGYNLPARFVIHTVGPIYDKEKEPGKLLSMSYINSLNLAEQFGLKSVAFSAISTGAYGYPKEEAARVVKDVVESFKFRSLKRVVLCYSSERDREIAEKIILGK